VSERARICCSCRTTSGSARVSVPGCVARGGYGLHTDSKAQAEQIRSIAIERLGSRVGVVPPAVMDALNEALRLRRSWSHRPNRSETSGFIVDRSGQG